MPGRSCSRTVLHRGGGDLVREPHALELLLRLDRARAREQRRRVGGVGRSASNQACVKVVGSPTMRSEACVPSESSSPTRPCSRGRRLRQLERPRSGRPRIVVGVAAQEADVVRPGVARRVLAGGLEADQHRLALAREDDGVVALHPPEVRQVEDVVGRADDERVEPFLRHQRAHAVELRVVAGPAHDDRHGPGAVSSADTCASVGYRRPRGRRVEKPHPGWGCGVAAARGGHHRTRSGAGSPCASCHETTGLRSTPIRSISASITSPGLR